MDIALHIYVLEDVKNRNIVMDCVNHKVLRLMIRYAIAMDGKWKSQKIHDLIKFSLI